MLNTGPEDVGFHKGMSLTHGVTWGNRPGRDCGGATAAGAVCLSRGRHTKETYGGTPGQGAAGEGSDSLRGSWRKGCLLLKMGEDLPRSHPRTDFVEGALAEWVVRL